MRGGMRPVAEGQPLRGREALEPFLGKRRWLASNAAQTGTLQGGLQGWEHRLAR